MIDNKLLLLSTTETGTLNLNSLAHVLEELRMKSMCMTLTDEDGYNDSCRADDKVNTHWTEQKELLVSLGVGFAAARSFL